MSKPPFSPARLTVYCGSRSGAHPVYQEAARRHLEACRLAYLLARFSEAETERLVAAGST